MSSVRAETQCLYPPQSLYVLIGSWHLVSKGKTNREITHNWRLHNLQEYDYEFLTE